MTCITKIQSDWPLHWKSYIGSVRVILKLPGSPVTYGEATGEVLSEYGQEPGMAIRLTNGDELWTHPKYVWPCLSETDDYYDWMAMNHANLTEE